MINRTEATECYFWVWKLLLSALRLIWGVDQSGSNEYINFTLWALLHTLVTTSHSVIISRVELTVLLMVNISNNFSSIYCTFYNTGFILWARRKIFPSGNQCRYSEQHIHKTKITNESTYTSLRLQLLFWMGEDYCFSLWVPLREEQEVRVLKRKFSFIKEEVKRVSKKITNMELQM